MGIRHRYFGSQFWKTFFVRKSKIPKSASILLVEKLNRIQPYTPAIRTVVFFGLAFALSLTAYRVTSEDAKTDWLVQNKPGFTIWEEKLTQKNYVRVLNPDELEKIFQSLPYSSSTRAPRVWITENSRVLVLLEPEEKRAYTLGKGTPEKISTPTWEPLGYGWEAWGSFSRRKIPTMTTLSNIKNRPVYKDLRQISY